MNIVSISWSVCRVRLEMQKIYRSSAGRRGAKIRIYDQVELMNGTKKNTALTPEVLAFWTPSCLPILIVCKLFAYRRFQYSMHWPIPKNRRLGKDNSSTFCSRSKHLCDILVVVLIIFLNYASRALAYTNKCTDTNRTLKRPWKFKKQLNHSLNSC